MATLDKLSLLYHSPFFGITLTLFAYILASKIYTYAKMNPFCNPVLIATVLIVCLMRITDIAYTQYMEGAKLLQFLLGPATVALAIPLYHQIGKLKKIWALSLCVLIVGVVFSAGSIYIMASFFTADEAILLSFTTKSITAPVAMGVSQEIGGSPSLSIVFTLITGVTGAIMYPKIFEWIGVKDDSIRGFAIGMNAHGIGTARAFQCSQEAGAFSGLAMGLSAFFAAVILPLWL